MAWRLKEPPQSQIKYGEHDDKPYYFVLSYFCSCILYVQLLKKEQYPDACYHTRTTQIAKRRYS